MSNFVDLFNEDKSDIKVRNNAKLLSDKISGSHNPEIRDAKKKLDDELKNGSASRNSTEHSIKGKQKADEINNKTSEDIKKSLKESYSNFTDLDLFNEDCDTCEGSLISKINATTEANKKRRENIQDKYKELRKETRSKFKDKAFKTKEVKKESFNFGSNLDL